MLLDCHFINQLICMLYRITEVNKCVFTVIFFFGIRCFLQKLLQVLFQSLIFLLEANIFLVHSYNSLLQGFQLGTAWGLFSHNCSWTPVQKDVMSSFDENVHCSVLFYMLVINKIMQMLCKEINYILKNRIKLDKRFCSNFIMLRVIPFKSVGG